MTPHSAIRTPVLADDMCGGIQRERRADPGHASNIVRATGPRCDVKLRNHIAKRLVDRFRALNLCLAESRLRGS